MSGSGRVICCVLSSLVFCASGSRANAAIVGSTRKPLPLSHLVVTARLSHPGVYLLPHARGLSPAARRRPLGSFSFTSIEVQATLYPADAASYTISNTVEVPVPAGTTYSVAVPFSNVPAHANEWVVAQLFGVASDGSRIAIGDLAGLVNVAGNTNATSITSATTATFQVFQMLAYDGFIATYDVDNDSNLASILGAQIAATGILPDPALGIFSSAQLATLGAAIAPAYARSLTVTSNSPEVAYSTLVVDYTNASELDFAANVGATSPFEAPRLSIAPLGTNGGCGSIVAAPSLGAPPHALGPPAFSLQAACSTSMATSAPPIVYGGHTIVSVNNGAPPPIPPTPPYGGLTSVPGLKPGPSTLMVPAANTGVALTLADPAGFAFGWSVGIDHGNPVTVPLFPPGEYANDQFPTVNVAPTDTAGSYSALDDQLIFDSNDPYGIGLGNLQLCTDVACAPLSAQPIPIRRQFSDPGTNLKYFKWHTGGVFTAIAAPPPHYSGYNVRVSGAGIGSLTTTTTTYFTPFQSVSVNLTQGGVRCTSLTVIAKDARGRTYENSGPINEVVMSSVLSPLTATSVTLKCQVASAGVYSLYYIGP